MKKNFLLRIMILIAVTAAVLFTSCFSSYNKDSKLPYYVTKDNAGKYGKWSAPPVPKKELFKTPSTAELPVSIYKIDKPRQSYCYSDVLIDGYMYRFMLVTDTAANVLYPDAMKKLGFKTKDDTKGYNVYLKEMTIAGNKFENVKFATIPNGKVNSKSIDGIVGMSLFQNTKSVTFDMKNNRILINNTIPETKGMPLKKTKIGGLKVDNVSIDGKICSAALSTSLATYIINDDMNFPYENGKYTSVHYGDYIVLFYHHDVQKLQIGNAVLTNMQPYLTGQDIWGHFVPVDIKKDKVGILLGVYDFFSQTSVTVDFKDKLCWVENN